MDVFDDPITVGIVVKLWIVPAIYVLLTLARSVLTFGVAVPVRSVLRLLLL
jgi:hypothetical protein